MLKNHQKLSLKQSNTPKNQAYVLNLNQQAGSSADKCDIMFQEWRTISGSVRSIRRRLFVRRENTPRLRRWPMNSDTRKSECREFCATFHLLAVWLSGNALVSIYEVTLRRARLVLGWVTVSGVQLPVRENIC